MQYANSDSLTSFLTWIPFISISPLIVLARTFKTMLNSTGKSGPPCLVPNLKGNVFFSFSSLNMMLPVGFLYMALVMLTYVPSMPTFWRIFIVSRYWIMSNTFLHLLRWSYGFYYSGFDVIYHIDWFADIEISLHSGDKSQWFMVNDPINILLDLNC